MSRPRTWAARVRKRMRRADRKVCEAQAQRFQSALDRFLRGDGDPNKKPIGISAAADRAGAEHR